MRISASPSPARALRKEHRTTDPRPLVAVIVETNPVRVVLRQFLPYRTDVGVIQREVRLVQRLPHGPLSLQVVHPLLDAGIVGYDRLGVEVQRRGLGVVHLEVVLLHQFELCIGVGGEVVPLEASELGVQLPPVPGVPVRVSVQPVGGVDFGQILRNVAPRSNAPVQKEDATPPPGEVRIQHVKFEEVDPRGLLVVPPPPRTVPGQVRRNDVLVDVFRKGLEFDLETLDKMGRRVGGGEVVLVVHDHDVPGVVSLRPDVPHRPGDSFGLGPVAHDDQYHVVVLRRALFWRFASLRHFFSTLSVPAAVEYWSTTFTVRASSLIRCQFFLFPATHDVLQLIVQGLFGPASPLAAIVVRHPHVLLMTAVRRHRRPQRLSIRLGQDDVENARAVRQIGTDRPAVVTPAKGRPLLV
mmetsp:Transcript_26745/g.56857  ORF Transcript_26745/g.56857 Transcript_26745/m.56857 type:complete len:411 (-) Transcript_26745:412-1644(-)